MTAQPHDLTLPDFVFWELSQESKHEYAEGRIHAFAGGTKRHAAIALEVSSVLHSNLHGGLCRVFGSDVLVLTQQSGRYADIVVTCDERDTLDLAETTVRFPKLIVEILSESTAAVDRGDKLDEYRTIETLQEYVLIDSRRQWVETYRRSADTWIASLPITRGELRFTSVDVTIPLQAMYEGSGV